MRFVAGVFSREDVWKRFGRLRGPAFAALSGVKWSALDGQARFLLVAGVALSVAGSVDMLFDRTMADLRDGSPTVAPPGQTAAKDGQPPGPTPSAP